jgi:anti-anti-sigma factor
MRYGIRQENGARVIELFGSLDMSNSEEARAVFEKVLRSDPNLILVDMGGLQFLKSSGFQVLFELLEGARKNDVPVAVVGPHDRIQSVLNIFRLDKLIPVYDSVTEALDDLVP